MGRVDSYPPGAFCWVDVAATDLGAARDFYGGIFGWEFVDVGQPGPAYLVARQDGADVCGIRPERDGEAVGWTSYVAVNDIAQASARAMGRGADIVGEVPTTPGTTRVVAVRDPAGAVLGLWHSADVPGAGVVNEVGTWTWNELVADDLDAAATFYAEAFGWEAQPIPGVAGRVSFRMGDLLVAGGHAPNPGEATEPRWDVSFRVADVDAALTRVQELGGRVLFPPMQIPVGRFTVVSDGGGVPMTLTEFERVVGSVAGDGSNP